jgi:transcriptional regulator with XRE-family HTH domain
VEPGSPHVDRESHEADIHQGIVFDPELRALLEMSRQASTMSSEASTMSPEASARGHDPPGDARYPEGHQPEPRCEPRTDYRSSPHAIGAGFLILVARELTGVTQRTLARDVGTSQPTLARIETGARTPALCTLLRVARAAGFELVLGLRRPDVRLPPKRTLDAFALLGTLHLNDDDGFADFVVYREPSPLEGPRDADEDLTRAGSPPRFA